MIYNNFQEICSNLGMSKTTFKNAFSNLKDRGILFTPAKTVGELITDEFPTRLAIIGPTSEQPPNVLSSGPFAITREFYNQTFLKLKSMLSLEELSISITFKRVEYEKLGAFLDRSITIESDEENFIDVANMSDIYDLSRPYVYSDYVWFDVKDEYKKNVQSLLNAEQSDREFWWWWTLIEFDENFVPPIPSDQPDDFSLMPDWFIETPKKYIPDVILLLLPKIFSHLTLGLQSKNLTLDIDELTEIINSFLSEYAYPSGHSEDIDKELLIKELCDYNECAYPVDVQTIISYLEYMGIISTVENQTTYELATTFEIPSEFCVTDEWEEKFNKFVETGSVLFAYMSYEEIVN